MEFGRLLDGTSLLGQGPEVLVGEVLDSPSRRGEAIGEVVDSDHVVALFKQLEGRVRANVAKPTGHQDEFVFLAADSGGREDGRELVSEGVAIFGTSSRRGTGGLFF